ncbi:endonuclease domain-containing 1 protein-like [Salvelinus alpinus]|uniref:endonuclease domain-containing 1 protein-like n=1 Tax=Salvelinus alpinus TaxID=8036 RepID=UPI0039FDAA3E
MMGALNHLSILLLLSLLPPALSHVVEKFSDVPQCKKFFLEETTPNLPGILYDGIVKDQNRYKPICQLFKNFYRFATLYDTTNRIPVFSAYTFTGYIPGRPDETWMMEPQLNGEKNTEMEKMGGGIYDHQSGNNDYAKVIRKNPTDYKDVSRGHLFPSSHAHDLDTQTSTFTLTNIVPQDSTFNGGSWNDMERNVREKLETDCISNNGIKAYVVTGAVPSAKNKLNDRVNIPDLLWTAYCCYNNKKKGWMAEAHWGWNQKEDVGKTLKPETLGALEIMLNKYHKGKDGPVKVFPKDCPRGP